MACAACCERTEGVETISALRLRAMIPAIPPRADEAESGACMSLYCCASRSGDASSSRSHVSQVLESDCDICVKGRRGDGEVRW